MPLFQPAPICNPYTLPDITCCVSRNILDDVNIKYTLPAEPMRMLPVLSIFRIPVLKLTKPTLMDSLLFGE